MGSLYQNGVAFLYQLWQYLQQCFQGRHLKNLSASAGLKGSFCHMTAVGANADQKIWNDYLLPYLVLDMKKWKTLPMAIQYLRGGYGSIDMGAMMGVLVLSMIPIIAFYMACQKHIIEGVVAGAVKG